MLKNLLRKTPKVKDTSVTSQIDALVFLNTPILARHANHKYQVGDTVYAKYFNTETNCLEDDIGTVSSYNEESGYYVIHSMLKQNKPFLSIPEENLRIGGSC